MDPHEFLDVADTLSAGVTEAEWRSAVSRAYYGIFHLARLLLQRCGFTVPRADQAHAYLWLRLFNSGHADTSTVGTELQSLRRARNRADYDLDQPLAQQEAKDRAQLARATAGQLDQVLASPVVQQQITDKIKDYEQKILRQNTWHP